MIIQYASDLHLEFPENKAFLEENPLQPVGDVLVLAGDIVPFAEMDKHYHFFSYLSSNFKVTYWIPGNHEYYYFNAATKSGMLKEKIRHNVFLVNNISVVHEDVKFIFSTLWSKISPAYEYQIEHALSDFRVIKYNNYRFSTEQYNKFHAKDLAFLQRELDKETNTKKVVVTHHVPTLMNYPEHYKGDVLNEAFAVELFDLIEATAPDCWIYGHSHNNTPDFEIGKTRMLTNQLGYVSLGEYQQFDTNKCVEIPPLNPLKGT
jgi:predicted phosphohydrolase